jgi:PhnB protein
MTHQSAKPAGKPWVSPYLVVRDVEKAMDFYERAFGLQKGMAYGEPDGTPFYGEVLHEDMIIMVGLPQAGKSHPGKRSTAMTLYCYTGDADTMAARAVAAGAEIIREPEDQFWGHRTCLLADPDGHAWMWAEVKKNVDLPEMGRSAAGS